MLFLVDSTGVAAPDLVFIRESDRAVYKPGTNTFVAPATNPSYSDIRNALTQWHATLLAGRVWYLSLAAMADSPGWVQVWGATAGGSGGVSLGKLGRVYVANDAFGKQGYDPDTDIAVSGDPEAQTWGDFNRRGFAILGGETNVIESTPTASETTVQFSYGGTVLAEIVYANGVYGQRNDLDVTP